ncbi:MAG: tetratricopeptide repeat protein [Nitrospirota bacterium]|nr:tetratricopeptide repeat protein [Nitrospirota bacterium]MDH5585313.1 tetratricopeptide repeat protein [Nitrospirota bacterium]MDH5775052.1 tetratricopeptide repeat protein [Nitrospirota bacterium]
MGYKIKDHADKSAAPEPVVALSSKEQFLFFVEEHRGLVWGGILLVVVLIGGLVILNWLSQQKQEEAWEMQGKAQHMYLDRPLDDIEKGKANIQQASGMFQDILTQYPTTPSAKISSFLLGNSFMEAENYQGAIEAYSQFLQKHSQDPVLIGLVQQRLGLAQLLNGNRGAAISAFDAVLENAHALNKDQVLFELAKLGESEEKIDEAVNRYKQLIQEFPLSPFSTEANLRVKVLAPEEAKESEKSETIDGPPGTAEMADSPGGEDAKDKKEEGQ